MALIFTEAEKKQIVWLHDVEGLMYKEIAEKLGRYSTNGKPAERAVMKQYVEAKKEAEVGMIPTMRTEASKPDGQPVEVSQPKKVQEIVEKIEEEATVIPMVAATPTESVDATVGEFLDIDMPIKPKEKPLLDAVSLEDMSKKQRIDYIRKTIRGSARAKYTFEKIFNDEERELFLQEYFQVLQEQDTLTNAEEQQLFLAIMHLVLYMRARERDSKAYNDFVKSNGSGRPYDSRWEATAQENIKQYEVAMKSLKLSREQRLKDMARAGNTFLDFAELLHKKESQENITQEILSLEKASEEELKRLQSNGWIIFGKSANNEPNVNYGQGGKD